MTRVSPTGSETQVAENEPAEATPAGERQAGVRADSGSVPAPSSQSGAVARNRTRLPQTASDTPLIAVTGALLLAAAAIVRRRRERII